MSSPNEDFTAAPPQGPDPARETGPVADQPVTGTLGLWDAVSIIVGIVVGAGIYQTVPFIFTHTDSPLTAMLLWGVAGVLSLIGALCYAELATAYPRDGGDIVYLNRAYGRWAGFLFGWVQLTVILTGSIGMMAFVFANYGIRLCEAAFGWQLGVTSTFAFAGGAVLVLTVLNILGVVFGKAAQNVLTVAKILGLGAIIVAGFMAAQPGAWAESSLPLTSPDKDALTLEKVNFPGFAPSLGVALILMLYTFGGWNDAAFVAAEVRDGKKNITRSLVVGIAIITALYLLVNAAYVSSLGFQKAQSSNQIAADVVKKAISPPKKDEGKAKDDKADEATEDASRKRIENLAVSVMCVIVMTSALGAVNGLIFTGARVYSTIGKDYPLLSWMSGWSRKQGAPVPALITQGVLVVALIFLFGTPQGRDGINWLLDRTATRTETKKVKDEAGVETEKQVPAGHVLKPMEWDASYLEGAPLPPGEKAARLAKGGFETLLACTAPVFWGFFLLTGLAVFVLRQRDPHVERPFRVPLYPLLPIVFCLSCGYMLYSSIDYAALDRKWKGGLALLGALPLVIGLLLYSFGQLVGDRGGDTEGT